MKFIEKHPYLLITAAIILACIVFQVPFGWSLLILLGYGLIVYIVNLGTAVGWTGYLLDGFLRRPKFVHKLYRFAIQHNTRHASQVCRAGSGHCLLEDGPAGEGHRSHGEDD